MNLPLRIERHDYTQESRVLLELWSVSDGQARRIFSNRGSDEPMFPTVRNAFWRGSDDGGLPRRLSPEHGFEYLVSLQLRLESSTFLQAYFDKGVRLN